MKILPYDPTNRESILAHASLLINRSLADLYDRSKANVRAGGKGDFGLLVESIHFHISQNSFSEPDFPEAGVELKTHPIERFKKKRGYRPKERLVFSIINYNNFRNQLERDLKTSSFWRKNKLLLLMTYLSEKDKDLFDYIFKIVKYWEFSETDLRIIEEDWTTIVTKIMEGKAHLLSGGDTRYLEACTKGGKYMEQPYSTELAISRAFALKPSYLKTIIEKELCHEFLEPIVKSTSEYKESETFEELVLRKINPYLGKTLDFITKDFGIELRESKDKYAGITDKLLKALLGIEKGKIEEFEKSGLIVRTCRLEADGSLKEHVSFPAFHFKDLVNEIWEDSEARRLLESRFFFVFFQETHKGTVLQAVKFWTMPISDLESVRSVWEKTVEVVRTGVIIKKLTNKRRFTFFPNASEHPIAHVRPHATTISDTFPLPTPENTTGANVYTKHSFWLNKSYVIANILNHTLP